MKKCSKCSKVKPKSEFYKDSNAKDGLNCQCKECKKTYKINKEYHKQYYLDNKEKLSAKSKRNHLWRLYNITEEQYKNLFEKQNKCCGICGEPQEMFSRSLHVDHCHTTGEVRGLLCNACNNGIGKLKDNVVLLQKAIEYLNNPPAKDKD